MKLFSSHIGKAALNAGLIFKRRNLTLVMAAMLVAELLSCAKKDAVIVPEAKGQAVTAEGKYNATPPGNGSKMKIAGTSNIHDWDMQSLIITGWFEVDPKVSFDTSKAALDGAAGGKVEAKAEVTIPVRTLKSYMAAMDEVYKKHMEEAQFKKIEYKLKELTLKKGDHAANTPFEFDSKGDLTVHGVTKTIDMPVKIEKADATKLKISGKIPLLMSDYKVQPPNPKLPTGEIKTGDEITVSFDWVVEKK